MADAENAKCIAQLLALLKAKKESAGKFFPALRRFAAKGTKFPDQKNGPFTLTLELVDEAIRLFEAEAAPAADSGAAAAAKTDGAAAAAKAGAGAAEVVEKAEGARAAEKVEVARSEAAEKADGPISPDAGEAGAKPAENGGQARAFVVCGPNKVKLRKEPRVDGPEAGYLRSEEEFEAFLLEASADRLEWLRLADGRGYVCTTSSKDVNRVVVLPKRKRGAASIEEAATSASKLMPKALLIKKEWCDQIFDNGKVWEIRGEPCYKRGRFSIAQSKSGTIVGEATLVDSLPVGRLMKNGQLKRFNKVNKKHFMGLECNMPKHRITDLSIVTYRKVYAWVLRDAVRYKEPLPYEHTQGCVKWVNLPKDLMHRADSTELAEEDAEGNKDDSSNGSSSDSDSSSDS